MQLPWMQSSKPFKIAVIGDLILDEYLEGAVNRISPEAPVPVHLVKNTSHTAGGAANVGRNIQLAGGEALLFGVCGDDGAALDLKNLLQAEEIDTTGILTTKERPTVKKTRVTAGQQQLVRIDWEKDHDINQEQQDYLLKSVQAKKFDCLLISDYGKGSLPVALVEKLIQHCHEAKVPVIVDPKAKDLSRYHGATLITPNRKEACEALGLDPQDPRDPEELLMGLLDKYNVESALITLGAEGMVYGDQTDRNPLLIPSIAREVFDVSGAGDTVAAILSLCYAAKTNIEQAMKIANLGAGRVVEKFGTQPVRLEDFNKQDPNWKASGTSKKVQSRPQLAKICTNLKKEGKQIVFTNGCFDIIHLGHLEYLEKTKSEGDILVVAINSDESVKRLKGPTRPVNNELCRTRLIAGLECVDYVTVFEEDTPLEVIMQLNPNVLAKGADYQIKDIVGADYVQKIGGKVARIPLVAGYSTTNIINAVQK